MSIAFAVETDNGLFLIDAGSPNQEKSILDQVHHFSNKPLKLIIITHAHFDHYGSALALRNLTHAPIAVGKLDFEDMAHGRTQIPLVHSWGILGKPLLPLFEGILKVQKTIANIQLIDNEDLNRFGLLGKIISTPGHTKGSVSIILSDGTAFVSDLIVTKPQTNPQCYYANDWSGIRSSLIRMQDLHPSKIYAGHSSTPVDSVHFQKLETEEMPR